MLNPMTGGPARASSINRNLAIACQALGLALAVGSQRVAIEGSDQSGLNTELRNYAPTIPLLANFALRKWLGAFGVTPRDAVQDVIERSGLKPQFMTPINLQYLGYAMHLVLTRRSTTIA